MRRPWRRRKIARTRARGGSPVRPFGWLLATAIVVGLSGVVALPTLANSSGNTLVGGFEIDGNYYEGYGNASTPDNPVNPQGDDWGTAEVEESGEHLVDGTGSADDTVLDSGHENRPLSEWEDHGQGEAPGASDIHNVWSYDQHTGGELLAYFAWDRAGTTGQVTWYLELNQRANRLNDNGVSIPNRSVGDLRVELQRSGSTLQIIAIDRWVGPQDTAWEPAGTTAIEGRVNDSQITVPGGTELTQQFLEFGTNLTQLFGEESCGFGDYIALNLRSTAGGANAELKDYVNVPIEMDSQCGELTIEKDDPNGVPVGGATFSVSPNPVPGAPADPPLEVTDNGPDDADDTPGLIRINAVQPGDYTVTETEPPPGYIPTADPQAVTVEEFGSETVRFANSLGSMSWTKTDATAGGPVCCATFTVTGTGGAAAGDPWNVSLEVTDNDVRDTDSAVGQIMVEGLPTGTYTVTETDPPDGYQLPSQPTRSGIEITAANPDVTISDSFADPQTLTDLSLLKVDVPEPDPLDGAVFQLYRSDGDPVGNEPGDGDVPVGAECTTGRDGPGRCTVSDLPFGNYYWYEISAAPGHQLPTDRTSPLIAVNAASAGETVTYEFSNTRLPGALRVEKLDETDGAPLGGATFELYLDDGDEVYDSGDTLEGSCITHYLGDGVGICTIEDLEFGTYFWVETDEPNGYGPPVDPVSDAVVIDAGNVDEVQVTTFEDPRLSSELTVEKADPTGEPLAGAGFELVLDDGDGTYEPGQDSAFESCVTGESGTCTIDGLGFGTYFWVETDAPQGYDLPTNPVSTGITIDTTNAGTDLGHFTFPDPRQLSELTVQKTDATSGDPLAEGHFALFRDTDGDAEQGVTDRLPDFDDQVIGTCTTEGNGLCPPIDGLDFGTYYWFETSAPAGYSTPSDRTSAMITVDASNAGSAIEPVVFEDPRLSTELSVEKVDEVDRAPLAGGGFELVLDDGDDSYEPGQDTPVGSCETDADGTCSVDGLDFGTYFWVETDAPDGYELPADPVTDPITVDASNAGSAIEPVVFKDPRLLTDLSVEKLDSEGGDPLDGARFQLYRDVGDPVGDEPDDDDVPVGAECTTGDDGAGLCTAEDLDFGDYYWYEVSAAPGYELPEDRTSVVVTIDADNAGQQLSVQIGNPRVFSELTVQKVDSSDDAPLAGAEFDLVLDTNGNGGYDDGDTVVDSCATVDGTCSIDGLDFGTYFWVETATPPGYPMPDNPVSAPITIDAGNAGEPNTYTFSNPRVFSELTVEKLDAQTEAPLAGGEFELLRDNGDGVYEDGVDQLVETCTSADDGTCSVDDLDFGTYFWVEAKAPAGYRLPDNPVSDAITIGADNAGTEIEPYTFFDQPLTPATWTVSKSSDPGSGSLVGPGDVITYTVVASELAGGPIEDVVVTDDLADVLRDAELVPGSIDASTGSATLEGTTLTWSIPSLSADETVTYQVRIDADASAGTIHNHASGDGAEPCESAGGQAACDATKHRVSPTSEPPPDDPPPDDPPPDDPPPDDPPPDDPPPDGPSEDPLPGTGGLPWQLLLAGALLVALGTTVAAWAVRSRAGQ